MTIQIHLKDNTVQEYEVMSVAYLHQMLASPTGFVALQKDKQTILIFKHMIKWITYK